MTRMEKANECRRFIGQEMEFIIEDMLSIQNRINYISEKTDELHTLCQEYEDELDRTKEIAKEEIEKVKAGK
jgi:hypothetical protein